MATPEATNKNAISQPTKQQQQSSTMSTKQLRQRRARILRDQAKEYREEQRVKTIIQASQSSNSRQMLKLYLVVGAALVVTLISAIQYTRPQILLNLFSSSAKEKKLPPYYIATLYPPSVIMDRDLPRFFRTFSIATKENEFAQAAVRRVIHSRKALKRSTGKLKVWVKGWDDGTFQQVLDRNVCGSDFRQVYDRLVDKEKVADSLDGVLKHQAQRQDLIMWCLLTTRLADGVFMDSVQMLPGRMSPIILAKNRGMIVRSAPSSSSLSDEEEEDGLLLPNRYTHSFYLHPRNLNYTSTLAILPSKVLTYLLDEAANEEETAAPKSFETYRLDLQQRIYQLVHSDGNDDKYLELTEVCHESAPPKGAIAETCRNTKGDDDSHPCCYYVLPEVEAKKFVKRARSDDEAEEEEQVELRRNLRESGGPQEVEP